MTAFLDWFAINNTLVIQIGFTVVLLLIAVYVYRIFTGNSSSASGTSIGSEEFSGVEQKINQILEHQKISGQMAESARQGEANSVNAEEMDRLKSEIYNLRQQLNESEKKVFEMAPAATTEGSSENAGAVTSSISKAEDMVKIEELNKEVGVLKAKLSDYEIIAEDISDLSDLRKENEQLRKKIESLDPNSFAATDLESADSNKVVESNPLPEINFEEPASDSSSSETKGDS